MNKPPFADNPARVCAFLDAHGIPYERFDHPPADTAEDCRRLSRALGCTVCKNLLLRTTNGSVFYLLMLPFDRRFVTGAVSKKLGVSRLSFASADDMAALLHTGPGSMSVTSLLFDPAHRVRAALDAALLREDYLGVHPSLNTATLKIPTPAVTQLLFPALGVTPEILHLELQKP